MIKNKFKVFNQFSSGVIVTDQEGSIKYNNNSSIKFIEDEIKSKTVNSAILTTLKKETKLIYHDYLLRKEDYDKYILIFIEDMKDVTDKLHDVRHDIKNLINPLVLLESDNIDVRSVVINVIHSLDDIQVKLLL